MKTQTQPLERWTKAELIAECRRLQALLQAQPAAPSAEDDDAAVMASLLDALSCEGRTALVSVTRLRDVCKARDFDAAVRRLYHRKVVGLHYHDFPYSLTAAERAKLVEDRGVFFCGIHLLER